MRLLTVAVDVPSVGVEFHFLEKFVIWCFFVTMCFAVSFVVTIDF